MISEENWISCTFAQASLDSASNLRREDYPSLSIVQCLSLATLYNWVYLVLLGSTSGCSLYELNAVAVGDVVRAPTGGDTLCKIPEGLTGCKVNNLMVLEGSTYSVNIEDSLCGDYTTNKTCTPTHIDAIDTTDATPTTRGSCSPPYFYVDDVGCIYMGLGGGGACWGDVSACTAFCDNMGGELFSPTTSASYDALRTFLLKYGGVNGQFWIGMIYSGGQWVWESTLEPPPTYAWRDGNVAGASVSGVALARFSGFVLSGESDVKLPLCVTI